MMSHSVLALIMMATVLVLPDAADAQLTQLDFDTKASPSAPPPSPEELLKAEEGNSKPSPPAPAASAEAVSSTFATIEDAPAEGRPIVLVDVKELPLAKRKVAPRKQGPYTDRPASDSGRASTSTITSRVQWEKPKGLQCGEPKTQRGFYLKAKALKEVLYRFSGSDGFYDYLNENVCSHSCVSGTRSWISGFSVPSASPAKFTIETVGERCQYSLQKREESSWQVLEGQKVICNCLPDRFR